MNEFWNHEINVGYYDKIVKIGINKKRGARAYWHITTLKTIKKYLLKNLIHLDYACGPGTLIGKYSNSISTGVDLSKKQIEYAKKNYFEKGTFLTTNEFNFEDYEDQYDVITLLGLIEFLNNDEINNLFVKLNKLLKNEGKIVLTTPNFSGIMKILEFLQNYKKEMKGRSSIKAVLPALTSDFSYSKMGINEGMQASNNYKNLPLGI